MLNRSALGFTAVAVALGTLASACGGAAIAGNAAVCRADDPANRRTLLVPPTLGGLRVEANSTATTKLLSAAKGSSTYLCNALVFALRDGKELKAVFSVERLSSDARPTDKEFRDNLVNDILGTRRKPEKIGDSLVYRGSVNDQVISVWFNDRFLELLFVREDQANAGVVDETRILVEALSLQPVDI